MEQSNGPGFIAKLYVKNKRASVEEKKVEIDPEHKKLMMTPSEYELDQLINKPVTPKRKSHVCKDPNCKKKAKLDQTSPHIETGKINLATTIIVVKETAPKALINEQTIIDDKPIRIPGTSGGTKAFMHKRSLRNGSHHLYNTVARNMSTAPIMQDRPVYLGKRKVVNKQVAKADRKRIEKFAEIQKMKQMVPVDTPILGGAMNYVNTSNDSKLAILDGSSINDELHCRKCFKQKYTCQKHGFTQTCSELDSKMFRASRSSRSILYQPSVFSLTSEQKRQKEQEEAVNQQIQIIIDKEKEFKKRRLSSTIVSSFYAEGGQHSSGRKELQQVEPQQRNNALRQSASRNYSDNNYDDSQPFLARSSENLHSHLNGSSQQRRPRQNDVGHRSIHSKQSKMTIATSNNQMTTLESNTQPNNTTMINSMIPSRMYTRENQGSDNIRKLKSKQKKIVQQQMPDANNMQSINAFMDSKQGNVKKNRQKDFKISGNDLSGRGLDIKNPSKYNSTKPYDREEKLKQIKKFYIKPDKNDSKFSTTFGQKKGSTQHHNLMFDEMHLATKKGQKPVVGSAYLEDQTLTLKKMDLLNQKKQADRVNSCRLSSDEEDQKQIRKSQQGSATFNRISVGQLRSNLQRIRVQNSVLADLNTQELQTNMRNASEIINTNTIKNRSALDHFKDLHGEYDTIKTGQMKIGKTAKLLKPYQASEPILLNSDLQRKSNQNMLPNIRVKNNQVASQRAHQKDKNSRTDQNGLANYYQTFQFDEKKDETTSGYQSGISFRNKNNDNQEQLRYQTDKSLNNDIDSSSLPRDNTKSNMFKTNMQDINRGKSQQLSIKNQAYLKEQQYNTNPYKEQNEARILKTAQNTFHDKMNKNDTSSRAGSQISKFSSPLPKQKQIWKKNQKTQNRNEKSDQSLKRNNMAFQDDDGIKIENQLSTKRVVNHKKKVDRGQSSPEYAASMIEQSSIFDNTSYAAVSSLNVTKKQLVSENNLKYANPNKNSNVSEYTSAALDFQQAPKTTVKYNVSMIPLKQKDPKNQQNHTDENSLLTKIDEQTINLQKVKIKKKKKVKVTKESQPIDTTKIIQQMRKEYIGDESRDSKQQLLKHSRSSSRQLLKQVDQSIPDSEPKAVPTQQPPVNADRYIQKVMHDKNLKKCKNCKKVLPNQNPEKKVRKIDASPERGTRQYQQNANVLGILNASKSLGSVGNIDHYEGKRSVNQSRMKQRSQSNSRPSAPPNITNTDTQHLEKIYASKQGSPDRKDGEDQKGRVKLKSMNRSPNMLKFLEKNKSKSRIELTKAYDSNMEKQREFFDRHSPDSRYFRLYVMEKNSNSNEALLAFQQEASKMQKVDNQNHKAAVIHSISPRASRRRINALRPFHLAQLLNARTKSHNEEMAYQNEKQKQKILRQLNKGDPLQKYKLYQNSEIAKQELERRAKLCDCDQHRQQRLLQGSLKSVSSGKSEKYVKSIKSQHTKGRKRGDWRQSSNQYDVLQESHEEDYDSVGTLDQNDQRLRRPCRRLCSTVHNPMFNHQNGVKKQRRAPSADHTKLKRKHEIKEFDWGSSEINNYINNTRLDKHKDQTKTLGKDIVPSPAAQKIIEKVGRSLKNQYDSLEREIEQGDMKYLYSKIDLSESQQKTLSILSAKQIQMYYDMVKQESIREQAFSSVKEQDELIKKCQITLKVLMLSLMLHKEYDIVNESYKRKFDGKLLKGKTDSQVLNHRLEPLLKLLCRCRNLYDAKHEVVRILVKTKKREKLLNQFESEIDQIDENRARQYYDVALKLSVRVWNQIDRLRVDNPLLNRPFIFNHQNLQSLLIKQVLNIRSNLKKRFKALQPKEELDQILDKTGKILSISELQMYNKKQEELMAQSENRSNDGKGSNQFRSPSRSHKHNDSLQSTIRREKKLDRKITLNLIRDDLNESFRGSIKN